MESTREDKFEHEEQFILRLPIATARKIREILRTKPRKLKKLLTLELDLVENTGKVRFGKTVFKGMLKNLPTIIESYKTCDKVNIFKTGDISQMLICGPKVQSLNKGLDLCHGLAPPMKNVRKRRFRKTLFNQDQAMEVEHIERELMYLLRTDMEAISTKFEILHEDNKENVSNEEIILFGNLSSDTDEVDID